MTINYKDLLSKYMQHVVDCEGVHFINKEVWWADNYEFTDEEKIELQAIADELYY